MPFAEGAPQANRRRTAPRGRPGIVTLLTDFGTSDAYVASMKGVILGLLPAATLVDLGHEVPPQDIRRAALLLSAAAPCFPRGTVHLVVVDPGVGTARRAVVVATEHEVLVGPDNGVFGPLLARRKTARAWELPVPRRASATFHGRDVFAPAAARIARGEAPGTLGRDLAALRSSPWPEPVVTGRRVLGEVAFVDRFGNLVTNIPEGVLPRPCEVRVGRRRIGGVRRTYGDVPRGRLMSLVESTGHLEIAVREGSAAKRLGAGAGTRVEVEG